MTNRNLRRTIERHLRESSRNKKMLARELSGNAAKAAELAIAALFSGKKLMFCGNGGSAADCQHLAAELVGRFKEERRAIAAISLTTNTSVLTAISNDYDFKEVFSRQVESLGTAGDILFVLSTSGNSDNIIEAVKKARRLKILTIGFLGNNGGKAKNFVDLPIIVPLKESDLVQEIHLSIGHAICELIERAFLSI